MFTNGTEKFNNGTEKFTIAYQTFIYTNIFLDTIISKLFTEMLNLILHLFQFSSGWSIECNIRNQSLVKTAQKAAVLWDQSLVFQ